MWQQTHYSGARPHYNKLLHVANARDYAFQVHSTTPNPSGPVTPVPGESQLSTSVSIDYLSLLTKDESIIETPRDPNWNLDFGRLTNETFVLIIFSNNRSQCIQNFHSPIDLQSSVPKTPSQTQSSKRNKSNLCHYYDNIIKDVMSDHPTRLIF